MPNMIGRQGCRTMEMNGGSYLTRTPCAPLFGTSFNGGGNDMLFALLDNQGRAGIIPLCGGAFARSYSVSRNSRQNSRKISLQKEIHRQASVGTRGRRQGFLKWKGSSSLCKFLERCEGRFIHRSAGKGASPQTIGQQPAGPITHDIAILSLQYPLLHGCLPGG